MTAQNNISGRGEHSGDDSAGKFPLLVRGGMLLHGLFLTGVIGSMLGFVVLGLVREARKALVYKPVTATVTSYTPPETKTDEFGEDESSEGRIEYRYVFAGKTFDATCHQDGESDNEYSRKLPRNLKVGDTIEAWCDPDEPENSTLEPVANPELLGVLIFMLPFAASAVLMLMAALMGREPRIRFPLWRRSSRKDTSVNGRDSGAYAGVFWILCPVSAFAFFIVSTLIDWRTAWVIGLLWMLVGIPLITLGLGRLLAAHRPAGSPPPTESYHPEWGKDVAEDLVARLPSSRKTLIGAVVFTLFWCGITGVFVGFVAHAMYKSYDVRRRFLTTDGTVLASKVKISSDSDGDTYAPLVKYSYVVDRREYTSTCYTIESVSTSNRSFAEKIVNDHPPGRKVSVWYDPLKPDDAVLNTETPSLFYFLLLFLQPFILVGIGGIIYTITLPHRLARIRAFLAGEMRLPWTIPCWGTLRRSTRRIVLNHSRMPLFAFGVGYGLTCFLSIFALIIYYLVISGDLENMPPSVIGRVFAVAGAIGVISMLGCRLRRKARFEIDEDLASLHVKSPKRAFSVGFSEIDHWFLRMTVRSTSTMNDSDGKDSKFAPLLALMTTDGTERPIHVFGAGDSQHLVAEKVAIEFAGFTGKPFTGMEMEEDLHPRELSISGMWSAMRAQSKAAKKYSDLN